MATQQEDYNNISFKDFLNNLGGSLYGYSIERNGGVTTLSIHSTSLSELDDDEDMKGELESFSYFTKAEILEDIATATRLTKIDFEKI
jgi:hypothetical protein